MTWLLDQNPSIRDMSEGERKKLLKKGILKPYTDDQGIEQVGLANPTHSISIKTIKNIKFVNPLIRRAYFEIEYKNGEIETLYESNIDDLFGYISSRQNRMRKS